MLEDCIRNKHYFNTNGMVNELKRLTSIVPQSSTQTCPPKVDVGQSNSNTKIREEQEAEITTKEVELDVQPKEKNVISPAQNKSKKKFIGKPINLTPRRRKCATVFNYASELKNDNKRFWKIITEPFQYLYSDGGNLLKNFEKWCIKCHNLTKKQASQNSRSVNMIWKALNKKLNTISNELRKAHNIDDFWFTPHLEEIKNQAHVPLNKRKPHLAAPTLVAKLGNFQLFLRFLQARQIYAGLKMKDISYIESKIKEMTRQLKPFVEQQKTDIKAYKSSNILTVVDFNDYNSSDHVKHVLSLLKRVQNEPAYPLTKQEVLKVRNYLAFILISVNALRSSNLMNITLQDF